MKDVSFYQARREELKKRHLSEGEPAAVTTEVNTGGVDHLALISSDLDATIRFYTEVLGIVVRGSKPGWEGGKGLLTLPSTFRICSRSK